MEMMRPTVFGLLLLALAGSVRGSQGGEPLRIGGQKQLFFDDQVVESMEPRVFRFLNQPVKYSQNPVIHLGSEWEQRGPLSHGGDAGTIFYDQEQRLFRFYGWIFQRGTPKKFIFYAESRDGIHWIKPRLGQVEYLGYDTNFIALPFLKDKSRMVGNITVFKDPAAKSEGEKYKMIYVDRWGEDRSMYPAHSGDGLHWIPYAVDRPAVPYSSDTNNNLI